MLLVHWSTLLKNTYVGVQAKLYTIQTLVNFMFFAPTIVI